MSEATDAHYRILKPFNTNCSKKQNRFYELTRSCVKIKHVQLGIIGILCVCTIYWTCIRVAEEAIFTGHGKQTVHNHSSLSKKAFDIHDLGIDFLSGFKNPCFLEERVDLTTTEEKTRYGNNEYFKGPGFRELFRNIHQTSLKYKELKCSSQTGCRLRCLPYFMVLGPSESETLKTYDTISQHPDVLRPMLAHTQYWNKHRFQGACLNDYMDLYDNVTARLSQSGYSQKTWITGEVNSIYTLTDPEWYNDPRNKDKSTPEYILAKDLYSILPDMKFIILLREPTAHIYWHYNNAPYGRDNKSPEEFHDRVMKSVKWWNTCTGGYKYTARACASGNVPMLEKFENRENPWWPKSNYAGTLRDGLYALFLDDLIKTYPKKNLLVLRAEDLYIDTNKAFEDIFSFLQLSSHTVNNNFGPDPERTVEKQFKPMKTETKNTLREFFRAFNFRLSSLLNNEIFNWFDVVQL